MFLQIESENHCTSQMRRLIDEVSIKQSRIVALEGIYLVYPILLSSLRLVENSR